MKRIYIILFSVLLLLITSIFIIFIFFSLPDTPVLSDSGKKKADYHYMMIGQGTDEMFSAQIHKGAQEAAEEQGAVVEVCNVRPSDTFTIEKYFDLALDSKVDGIAIQVIDSAKIAPLLEKAARLKIPIVTYETDSVALNNIPTVGTNSFQAGNEAGKLALACKGAEANIAVILNGLSNTEESASKNLKVAGIADAFKDHPDVKITVKTTDGGVFGAEKVTSEILRGDPDINLIIATNEMDTLGIIDVIVDFNKVGDIDVIGYGSLPEIIQYIRKSVVYGTVVPNPKKIGSECIRTLVELSRTGYSSAYLDTGVFSYTKENVDEYEKAQ